MHRIVSCFGTFYLCISHGYNAAYCVLVHGFLVAKCLPVEFETKKGASTAVECPPPPLNCKQSRREALMEHNMSQVSETVSETVGMN